MNGYVIEIGSRKVIHQVCDVTEVGDDHISGAVVTLAGFDKSIVDIIVTDSVYKEGDVIPENEVDRKDAFPSPEKKRELLKQRMADLELVIADLLASSEKVANSGAASKLRILANASITRLERGESDITAIVKGYSVKAGEQETILAEIQKRRPDIMPVGKSSS